MQTQPNQFIRNQKGNSWRGFCFVNSEADAYRAARSLKTRLNLSVRTSQPERLTIFPTWVVYLPEGIAQETAVQARDIVKTVTVDGQCYFGGEPEPETAAEAEAGQPAEITDLVTVFND